MLIGPCTTNAAEWSPRCWPASNCLAGPSPLKSRMTSYMGIPWFFLLDLTIHWDLWVSPQYSLIGLCQCFLIDQECSFGCSTVDATSIGFLLENLSLYSSFVRNNALSYMTLTMKLMKVWFKMSEWSCHNFSCLVLSSFCSWCNFSSFRNTSPILWNL